MSEQPTQLEVPLGSHEFPQGTAGHTTYESVYTGPQRGWVCECGERRVWPTMGGTDPHQEWIDHAQEVK